MNPDYLCYLNGELLPYHKCRLHISDLQLQRGYGIFDYFRSRNGSIPWLDDYVDRLYNSIKLAKLETSLDQGQFKAVIQELQKKNKDEHGAFKVIVSGGYSESLESVTGEANFLILNVPWKRPAAETFEKGVQLLSMEYVRPSPEIKTLNYFNTMMMRHEMKKYDAVDLLYHTDTISEASRANVFFVKKGQLFTPSTKILYGITRKQVLSLLPDAHLKEIPYSQLYDFEEMFLSSTSRDITPVVGVKGRKIGTGKPGPMTLQVMQAFRERGW